MSEQPKKKQQSNEKKHCDHCGRNGHTLAECRFIGKSKCQTCQRFHEGQTCAQFNSQYTPQNSQNNNKRSNTSNTWTQRKKAKKEANDAEEDAEDAESSNLVVEGQFIALNAENSYDILDREIDSYDSNAYLDQPYDWLADTGSTAHITHRREIFATYQEIPKIAIKGVGAIKAHAIGRGTVYLQSECDRQLHTFELNNVLHVPSNRNNIFSLGRWEQEGRSIFVRNSILYLRDETGKDMARGTKVANKLYQMSFRLAPDSSPEMICFSVDISDLSWEEWHRRMVHIGYSGLRELYTRNMIANLKIDTHTLKPDCIPCVEGKHHIAPFGPAIHNPTQIGELTHVDLWGKYDTASIYGNRYFVLMVDDATRFITVRFLKRKSQAAQKVIEYMAYLRARGKSPCGIRVDRGTEFVNETLSKYRSEQGIELQMTAPYSPSQNGIAERMNRTLVELVRTILTASNLPEFLWELAVAHVAYMRNFTFMRT